MYAAAKLFIGKFKALLSSVRLLHKFLTSWVCEINHLQYWWYVETGFSQYVYYITVLNCALIFHKTLFTPLVYNKALFTPKSNLWYSNHAFIK